LLPVLLASSGYSAARAPALASSASRCVSSSGVTLPSLVAFSTASRTTGISSACLLRASSSTSCFSSGSCSWSASRGATRYKYSSSPSRRACVWFGVLSLSASLTTCTAPVASSRRRAAARSARKPLGATSTPLDTPAYSLKSFALSSAVRCVAFPRCSIQRALIHLSSLTRKRAAQARPALAAARLAGVLERGGNVFTLLDA